MACRAWVMLCASLAGWSAAAEQPSAIYESSVAPLLRANCLPCHNQRNRSSGLALDSRDAILKGGARGPAAKPGAPDESLLIQAIEHRGALKMPLTGRLNAQQVALLRKWVEQGVPWAAGGGHWAFRPPQRPPLPEVAGSSWPRNPIDRFVLARLERERVKPSPPAEPHALLRRVSLDLTGIPPSPEEIAAFVSDRSPDAYEKAVDRLLASPHYGERWGRHWLDLARYADSDGYTIDSPRQIWKYRDWVIDALNRDMPFDRFTVEQIAGDLIPGATVDQIVATGFHRNTPSNYEGGIDFEQYRVEAVADRVATTGAAFLGVTLGCARCHDHKYDPIKQREFYQLFAFFNNVDEITSEAERAEFNRPVLELPTPEEQARSEAFRAQFAAVSRELAAYVKKLSVKQAAPGDPPRHKDPGLEERVANLRMLRRRQPKITSTLVMRELPKPRETWVHVGGDFLQRGETVSPGVPAALSAQPVAGTRLDLARWLVSAENPLTARVTVNRMWQAYFGKGLVETESDFGVLGAAPTHPELLDWLAVEFMERGWSQKAMHRLIVTSATYRQASRERPELAEADPYNRLLARQARFRLEAEILRDAALAASGLLSRKVGGPSVYPPIPEGAMAVTQVKREWPVAKGPDRYRRGLYTFFYRTAPHPGLGLFDAPDATAACTRRIRSNSPLQALTLLNDESFTEFARALARRVMNEAGGGDASRIDRAFLLALGRAPGAAERERLLRYVALQRDEYRTNPDAAAAFSEAAPADAPELAAWTAACRVLFNLDEFLTRE